MRMHQTLDWVSGWSCRQVSLAPRACLQCVLFWFMYSFLFPWKNFRLVCWCSSSPDVGSQPVDCVNSHTSLLVFTTERLFLHPIMWLICCQFAELITRCSENKCFILAFLSFSRFLLPMSNFYETRCWHQIQNGYKTTIITIISFTIWYVFLCYFQLISIPALHSVPRVLFFFWKPFNTPTDTNPVTKFRPSSPLPRFFNEAFHNSSFSKTHKVLWMFKKLISNQIWRALIGRDCNWMPSFVTRIDLFRGGHFGKKQQDEHAS